MRPTLRSTSALALLLAAACSGETTNPTNEAQAAASTGTSGAAEAPADAAQASAAPEKAQATQPTVVAASGGRPAMLDTGIDLTRLKDASTPTAGAAFPPVHEQPTFDMNKTPATVQGPPGKIELVEGAEETHFGELLEGDKASSTFRFASSGENPLIIERVKPSCGCTAAEIELVSESGERSVYDYGQPIPVGAQFELAVSINTTSRRGPFASNISIYSNDPASPLRLQLKADVKPVLEIEPISLDFGTITSGDVKDGVITIRSDVLDPFRLELDETRVLEPLKAELRPIEPDAEGRARTWELAVSLGPNTPEGMRRYPLRILTDVPQAPPEHGHEHAEGEAAAAEPAAAPAASATRELTATITANVTGLVVASPNFISLGVVRPGEPVERTVRIESVDPTFQLPESPSHTFQSLTGGEFGLAEHFTVSTRPVPESEGRAIEMTLRLEGLPEDFNQSFGGMVTLQVGHPTKPEINVRFSGVARAGIPAAPSDNR